VSVALDRADGVSEADLDAWLRSEGIPPLLAGSAIAMGSLWTPVQRDEITSNSPMNLGSGTGGENRTLQMFFTETDVRESWPRFLDYVERVNASGLAKVVFAAPFHRTIIGTDTYTDQLW